MTGVVRIGDPGSHGGSMITATSVGLTNGGKQVCVDGDILNCSAHGHQPVTHTQSILKSNGKYVLTVGCTAACGATITAGSTNFFAG